MERDKLSAIAFIAIILGAVGVGVGAFAAGITLTGGADGNDGDDGDDGATGITTIKYITIDEYPCASETEVNNALTLIGSGYGKIIIVGDFNVTSPIQINGGGSYIIEGTGFHTITCDGDVTAFDISDAKSCILKDLIINASAIPSQGRQIIYINEPSDNPVYINNLHIFGDSDRLGIGIDSYSQNVWVYNCYISHLFQGIALYDSNTHIYGNTIKECTDRGIYCTGISWHNTFECNYIESCQAGFALSFAYYCTIANNVLKLNQYGCYLGGGSSYNTVTGNVIIGNISGISDITCGIQLNSVSSHNTIGNNGVFDHVSTTAIGYGILISTGNCDDNTVVGNTGENNEVDFKDNGSNTNSTSNNFDIIG